MMSYNKNFNTMFIKKKKTFVLFECVIDLVLVNIERPVS